MKYRALCEIFLFYFTSIHAFAPLTSTKRRLFVLTSTPPLNRQVGETRLHATAGSNTARVTLAGVIWTAIEKFRIGPEKAKQVVTNLVEITQWQDLVLLGFLAFLISPLAKGTGKLYDYLFGEEGEEENEMDQHKRTLTRRTAKKQLIPIKKFGFFDAVKQISEIALSVYAMDILCVFLTTIDFSFPNKWALSSVYSKLVYSTWVVRQLLLYKKRALVTMLSASSEESVGRIELIDKLLNGMVVGVYSLVILDWLNLSTSNAMTGFVAFGSTFTLAFTLASQGLVKELLSGLFLMFSNKMYVGDNVSFGDGTSGKVMKLGWMETILRGSDNVLTRVPNTLLSSQKVSNVSRIKKSQVKQTLRFRYDDVDKISEIVEEIRKEIKESCPRLITDGSRPFRVFWTNFNEDHLEVMVDTHHNIAPIGDAYWINRQNVLIAISRAIGRHGVKLAQLYRMVNCTGESEWRTIAPRHTLSDDALNFKDEQ